ncbi:transposase, partial [Megasphaera sp. BL7]|uniref:IS200/IS605 family accessory protein TnpB-related protein n=1 Tax=Megasphaera sp. BL7 TaxID=1285585 RepID=UPI0003573CC7
MLFSVFCCAKKFKKGFCIRHQIGIIVCGYNRDFKRGLKLGKVTNQHFTQISLSYLRSTLKYLCERYGITYLEQEESYTSQAGCLDLDDIPYTSRMPLYRNVQRTRI